MSSTQQDPTALLLAWGGGDQAAFDALLPLVHDELRQIARRCLAGLTADEIASVLQISSDTVLRD